MEIPDTIKRLVDRLIERNNKISNAKTPQEQTALQRQIEAIDDQKDQLVYNLYGLTEEEIKIIEGQQN